VRINWRSIEWLNEEYRARIEVRLESMAGDGGADRVEIASRALSDEAGGCTEVRISGVIKKCQLTAVREHHAPERALNDALDAFERSVSYALKSREEAAAAFPEEFATVGVPRELAGFSVARMTGSMGAVLTPVLRPIGALADRVRRPRRVRRESAVTASRAVDKPSDYAASGRLAGAGSSRRRRRGLGGFSFGGGMDLGPRLPSIAASVAAVIAVSGAAFWLLQGGENSSSDIAEGLRNAAERAVALADSPETKSVASPPPLVSEPVSDEPTAYSAVAGDDDASLPVYWAIASKR